MRTTWTPGAATPRDSIAGPAEGVAFNPFVSPAALRSPARLVGPATEWLIAFGAATGGDPGTQRLHALRRGGDLPWELTTIPDDGLVVDPLPGLAAAARSLDSVEVFAVDDDSGGWPGRASPRCAGGLRWPPFRAPSPRGGRRGSRRSAASPTCSTSSG